MGLKNRQGRSDHQAVTVAEQLATIRKQKGLSQAKLARETGLSASTIAMYETNRRSPDLATLKRLARALDVETEALAGQSATSQTATEEEQTVQEQTVNTELTLQVSPEEARILLAMRMSPVISNFLLSYVTATEEERERLARTWQVIRSFQTTT